MKKQFLAMLSAVAVAGTVITVPLVSSQAAIKETKIIDNEGANAIGTYKSYINIEPNGDPGQQTLENDSGAIKHQCNCESQSNTNHGIAKDITEALQNAGFKSGDKLSVSVKVTSSWYDQPATAFILLDDNKTELATVSHDDGSHPWSEATLKGEEKVTFNTYTKAYFVVTQHCGTVNYSDINLTLIQDDSEEPEQPTATPGTTDQPGKTKTLVDTTGMDYDELQRLIDDEMIGTIKADVIVDRWGGYDGSFFDVQCRGGSTEEFDGIVVKLEGAKPGDTVDATYMLQTTGNGQTETALARNVKDDNPIYYSDIKTDSPGRNWKKETYKATVPGGDGEIYLYIGDQSGRFYVDNLVIKLTKAGAATPTDAPAPTDTPTPTAEPTEKPTDEPKFTCEPAKFKITNGPLDGALAGATLEDDRHVIKSADGISVVSAWKCVFTGDAPSGLEVTATSGENSGSAYVGETETAIGGGGAVTFYVLVNSAADDIKFEATVLE